MSIYIHIEQRSHNNMLLILCGTLLENTKNPAYNCTYQCQAPEGGGHMWGIRLAFCARVRAI